MSFPERKKRKASPTMPPLTINPSPAHDLLFISRKRRRREKKEPSPTMPPLTPNPSRKRRRKRKKKKKKLSQSPTPQSTPSPTLPHDLLLSCIARVSRLYYPTLSLVSKSFRSLIASPELYKARSLLGHTESCLYVCMVRRGTQSPTWYTLCRKPNRTETETETGGYVLAKVPIPDSHGVMLSGLVAVGSNIYNIGGYDVLSMNKTSYSSVSILDCRSHTFSEAPSLLAPLHLLSAGVIDGKIYVAGGDSGSKNAFQVLDTKAEAQVWDYLPSGEMQVVVYQQAATVEGKFHLMTSDGVVAYDPKQGKWDAAGPRLGWRMYPGACCEIDKVFYSASSAYVAPNDQGVEVVLAWYDYKERMWRNVAGLVGLPKLTRKSNVRVAEYGGKMGVMWEEDWFFFFPWGGSFNTKIWCAEIALERRNSSEIWGKVDWLDHVLTIPATLKLGKVLAATL